MRVLVRDVPTRVGEIIEVQGWLHKQRKMGGLNFINIRDRSGLVQALIEDKDEVEKLRGLQIGTVLKITGEVISDERAPNGVEIHEPKLEVIVPVTEVPPIEIDKQIQHKSENLDTLFENRVLNVRNIQEQKIFKIRADLTKYIREFLGQNEFVEIQTPKLLAEATEGGAEVFKLDYFGKEATLAQSPQFYKQIMVGAFERVFEIGPAFRAEPSATTRHMSEVTMLDIEMGFVEDHDEVLNMVGDMAVAVIRRAYEEHADDLKSLNAPELVVSDKVPQFTVAEIHELYSKANNVDVTDEKDLIPDEERWICDYAKKKHGSELVYAVKFPVEAMKFYHQVNPEDPTTVLWGDLLFRGLEIATVPLREHRYEKLVEQMKNAGLDPELPGYKYYLQAFKFGLPQHGGCGFGIDRLVEKTIGLKNVKEATLFPRDINRLTP
jgi:nondiscriminating aspartyl-tRNA synthetase